MARKIRFWFPLLTAVLLASVAAAQNTARVDGQVLDQNGKPFADVTVQFKNPETGQTLSTKTDSNGKFVQLGLNSGVFDVSFIREGKTLFTQKFQVRFGEENILNVDFKKLIEENKAANVEEEKKHEEEQKKFEGMKEHFDTGRTAMTDYDKLRDQLKTTPKDQAQAIQDKIKQDCETGATEFQQAEQAVPAKDAANHSTILGNLARAQECLGHYGDAAASLQKAIDLRPAESLQKDTDKKSQAQLYSALATSLAKAGKYDEASAACDKGIAIDPSVANQCWKNLGIVLSNGGKMKEAVAPLQKATAADPKDAQGWYLLGSALAGSIDSKMEGEKIVFIIPPGTADAFQRCVALAPNPYEQLCKDTLNGLAAYGEGVDTTINKKKKKG